MAKPEDTTSTERLLNVIRGANPMTRPAASPIPSSSAGIFTRFYRGLSLKSPQTIGIDFAGSHLRMTRTARKSDGTPAIIDFRSVPLPSDIAHDPKRMADFLGTELTQFCVPPIQAGLWAALPLEDTDIRCLRVPKVAKSKLENAVFWTYQKESAIDKNQTLFDFLVLGDVVDNGAAKTEVLACTAPHEKINSLKELFQAAGFPLTGIAASGFGMRNLFKAGWLSAPTDALSCSLLIDFNWSRIDIFRPNGDLIISRGIKAGISGMIESIKNEVTRPSGSLGASETRGEEQILELPVFEAAEADQILQLLSTDVPSSIPGALLKSDDVFEMVLPALERLIRQVERTLEHVTLRFSDGPVGKLFISGPIIAYPRLAEHVGAQLALPHEVVDPFSEVSSAVRKPSSMAERAAYISSLGLSLSDHAKSPNFLVTRREAVSQTNQKNFRLSILLASIGIAAIILTVHVFRHDEIKHLESKFQELSLSIDMGETGADNTKLLALASQINQKNLKWKAYSRNYLPVAAVGEITSLAPQSIRFIRVEGSSIDPSEPMATDAAEKPSEKKIIISMDAVVEAPPLDADATLAKYLMALTRSPLFTKVSMKKKTSEVLGARTVLRFTLDLEGA